MLAPSRHIKSTNYIQRDGNATKIGEEKFVHKNHIHPHDPREHSTDLCVIKLYVQLAHCTAGKTLNVRYFIFRSSRRKRLVLKHTHGAHYCHNGVHAIFRFIENKGAIAVEDFVLDFFGVTG